MTRQELIEQAAIEYCGGNKGADARVRGAFLIGAEWADEHPKDDPFEGILIHGNNDAYRLGYKKAVDKACEWLKCNFNMPDDFECHFRKAMEEQQ